MMMICKTKEEFESCVSTYIMPDEELFNRIKPNIVAANRWVKSQFLGKALYEHYEDMEEGIKETVLNLVVLQATADSIPYLDLTLTQSGFGVVDNAQMAIAPASKERVERLLKQVKTNRDECFDFLLIEFLKDEKLLKLFKQSPAFYVLTNCLINTAIDLNTYAGYSNATRAELGLLAADIARSENDLIKRISIEYYNELIEKRRNNKLTPADEQALQLAKQVLGNLIKGEANAAYSIGNRLVNMLEASPDDYPTYMDSQVYKLKQKHNYENKKDDPCFLF